MTCGHTSLPDEIMQEPTLDKSYYFLTSRPPHIFFPVGEERYRITDLRVGGGGSEGKIKETKKRIFS
jgi:hypothetical protein